MTDQIDERTIDMAELASEFWKLLRNYDRVVEAAPENLKAGLIAQAKYGNRRLVSILDRHGMHIETFDGVTYSANLPVTAVNAEDFADGDPVIEQTLEPAIVVGTTAVRTGRVFLRAERLRSTSCILVLISALPTRLSSVATAKPRGCSRLLRAWT